MSYPTTTPSFGQTYTTSKEVVIRGIKCLVETTYGVFGSSPSDHTPCWGMQSRMIRLPSGRWMWDINAPEGAHNFFGIPYWGAGSIHEILCA